MKHSVRSRRPGPRSDRWLLSYADFITLLLATFIVLYAITSADVSHLEELMGGLHSAFSAPASGSGVLAGGSLADESAWTSNPNRGRTHAAADLELLLLRDRVQTSLESRTAQDDEPDAVPVRMRTSGRGLTLSLASSDFFEPAGVAIHPSAMKTLDAIATVLRTLDTPIRVEGHTDDRPIHSARFPSNWELSTARASAVVRTLIEQYGFAPERLIAAGYADTHPLVANDSDENRALNRRIDLIVLSESARRAEPDAASEEHALRRVLEQLPPLD